MILKGHGGPWRASELFWRANEDSELHRSLRRATEACGLLLGKSIVISDNCELKQRDSQKMKLLRHFPEKL